MKYNVTQARHWAKKMHGEYINGNYLVPQMAYKYGLTEFQVLRIIYVGAWYADKYRNAI